MKPNSLNDDNNSNHNESGAYLENIIIVFTYNDIGYDNKNNNGNFSTDAPHFPQMYINAVIIIISKVHCKHGTKGIIPSERPGRKVINKYR